MRLTPILLLVLACRAAAVEPAVPRTPELLVCSPGTTRKEEPYSPIRGGIRVSCLRFDGNPLGPQAAWYANGTIAEYERMVDAGDWTAIEGLQVRWQPDGRLFAIGHHRGGFNVGAQVTFPIGELPITRFYGEGGLIDLYRGAAPPAFRCQPGLRLRMLRVDRRPPIEGFPREAATYLERWCEDTSRRGLPDQETSRTEWVPGSAHCIRVREGLFRARRARFGPSRAEVIPAPAGTVSIEAVCGDSDLWRRGRREGPYVARDFEGWEVERGSFRAGLRHGVWVVGGRRCIRWDHGAQQGVATCPAGTVLQERGAAEQIEDEIERIRAEADWPRLEEIEMDELRLWSFSFVSRDTIPFVPALVALRWRPQNVQIQAQALAWGARSGAVGTCARPVATPEHPYNVARGMCHVPHPHHSTWSEVLAELDALDVWELAAPVTVVPAPGSQHVRWVGLYVERRRGGRIDRTWHGSLPGLAIPPSHQVRAVETALRAIAGPRRTP
ncbi:MAG: hypothetical protein GY925_23405 [Actinomycetia bacterium]|nr:hypothetical protein [Actinomycetes bacterium]